MNFRSICFFCDRIEIKFVYLQQKDRHQDVAEEVIWRKMIYNDSFQEALKNLLME